MMKCQNDVERDHRNILEKILSSGHTFFEYICTRESCYIYKINSEK